MLAALATHAGNVLPHTWLLTQVWGSGYADNIQTLHVFISQLRRKIEPDPAYIQTEPGVGCRFRSSVVGRYPGLLRHSLDPARKP